MMRRLMLTLPLLAAIASSAAAASYTAKLAGPAEGRIVVRDISWNCGSGSCQGTTDESRPTVLCEGLAKRAGKIESFAVDGRAFGEADLARCNSSAKAPANEALAAQ